MTFKKKNILLVAAMLLASTMAWAVPALKVKRTIKLADGTNKEVVLVGDENTHFFLDKDNNAYTEETNGRFVRRDIKELRQQWSKKLAERNEHRIKRAAQLGLGGNSRKDVIHRAQWGAEQNPISGKKKGLVILVNFADREFNLKYGHDYYDGFFNKVGFSENKSQGSVHDYFMESSYGQFDLTFDVYGPVTVSQNMSHYGQNQYGADAYPAELVSEACALADKQGADFSQYDWDGDGYVDQVFIVYAGYGENMGAPENTIWPHESTLTDAEPYGDGNGPVRYDGVLVDTYAMTCELFGPSGTVAAGIGTACHEFSHCMCIPDLYDLESQNLGMAAWDLMDFGSYNGTDYGIGNCPAPYTSYERMYCGWLTPTELSTACVVPELKPIDEAPQAYIIYNEANKNEYYLLENKQQTGFGTCLPSHGMMVLHVLYDKDAWIKNVVNVGATPRMTYIAADNEYTMEGCNGDSWPGTSGNTELTSESSPAATLYTQNSDGSYFMNHDISDIAESKDGIISFLFDGGEPVDTPVAYSASGITSNSFTASWSPVNGAVRYNVQLTAVDANEQRHDIKDVALLLEDFSGFNNGTEANGTMDVSGKVDQYMQTEGWEASNIYTTPRNEVRIGNQRAGKVVGGNIITPWLHTDTKVVTVSFVVRKYASDAEPIYLLMGEGMEGGAVAKITPEKENERWVITASSDTNDWWWGLSCDARCYVSEMNAYEGHLTQEDVEAGYVSAQLTETKTITTDQTSYTFTDMSPEKNYSYQVKAFSEKGHSGWSNKIDVTLSGGGDDAIESIRIAEVSNGAIFDLAGRRVSCPRNKGVYIVNGKKFLR